MAESPLTLKHTALRAPLEVMLYGSPAYSLCLVSLVKSTLLIADACYTKTIPFQLTSSHTVKAVTKHAMHYVVVEMALKMKMPSREMAVRWAEEMNQSLEMVGEDAATSSLIIRRSSSTASLSPPMLTLRPREGKVPERRNFSFPLEMMGVTQFDEEVGASRTAAKPCDSALSSIAMSISKSVTEEEL